MTPPSSLDDVTKTEPSPVGRDSVALGTAFSLALQAAFITHGAWLSLGLIDSVELLQNNIAPPRLRSWMVFSMLAVALGTLVATSLAMAFRWQASSKQLHHWARWLGPVTVLANVPILFRWETWQRQPLHFLMASVLTVVLLDRAIRMAAVTPLPSLVSRVLGYPLCKAFTDRVTSKRPGKHSGLIAVAAAATAYAVYMSFYTVRYHLNGYTSSYDLGIEENIVWQTLHGGPLFKSSPIFGPDGTHFGRHANFIAFAVAPIYAIHQHASTLLVIEAVLVGAAAIPLYLFAKPRVGQLAAALVSISFLLHPGVHGAQLYDFHYLTIAPFFIWFLVLAIDRRWIVTTVVFTVLVLSIREDVAAGLATLGCFLMISGEASRVGAALMVVGLGYFGVMKFKIMPDVEGPAFLWLFKGLLPPNTDEPSGIIKTVVGNPVFTMGSLLTKHKLVYALQMLLPVAFLPLRRIAPAVLLLPAIVFTLLVTQDGNAAPAPIQLSFQYTMHWIPYLYVGLVWVLGTLREKRTAFRSTLVSIALGSLLVSYQYGAILQQNTARAGFDPFRFENTAERLDLRHVRHAVLSQIPPDAAVAASERLVPHLSNRDNAYGLRAGLFDAEWVVFSFGLPESRKDDQAPAKSVLKDGSFGVVEIREPYVLLKRGADTARNSEALALISRKP